MISTNLHRSPLLLTLVVACLALSACERKAATPAILASEDSVLRFVPADTPYVLVNPEPLDDDLVGKMTGGPLLAEHYDIVIRDALMRETDSMPEDSEEREQAERVANVASRMLDFFTLEGMRSAGFDVNESMAFYGNGLLPVLRARLIDADAFEAALADLEREADYQLDTAEIDGNSYRYAGDEEGRVIIGAFGDWVVMTIAPGNFTDAELRKLAGLDLPAVSLAKSGTLAEIARDYGYTSHYLGFVDVRRLAQTFVDQPGELDALLFEGSEFDRDALSEVCREEILEFAEIAPRAVFGYTKIAADGIDGSATLELREDLAAGLMTLPAVVPGLGIDSGSLLSFGLSVQPLALREFYEGRLDAMAADPYECEHFSELEENAARGRQALAQPVPPVVYGFRGIVAVFDDIDISTMQPPPIKEADAAVLVAVEDAPSLLMAASMFSPDLAALDIQPDGQPVALEIPQAAWLAEPPYVALTDSSLAIATGADSAGRIERLMAARGADPAPFLSVAGDAGRYYTMVAGAIGSDDDVDLSPAARDAIRDSMHALAAVYDRMQVDVRFTTRGVQVDVGMTFRD